jgi:hypothetical protein
MPAVAVPGPLGVVTPVHGLLATIDRSMASSVEPRGSTQYGCLATSENSYSGPLFGAACLPIAIPRGPRCLGSKAPGRRSPRPRSSALIAFGSTCATTAAWVEDLYARFWPSLAVTLRRYPEYLPDASDAIARAIGTPTGEAVVEYLQQLRWEARLFGFDLIYAGRTCPVSATRRRDVPAERHRSSTCPDVASRQVSALGSERQCRQTAESPYAETDVHGNGVIRHSRPDGRPEGRGHWRDLGPYVRPRLITTMPPDFLASSLGGHFLRGPTLEPHADRRRAAAGRHLPA